MWGTKRWTEGRTRQERGLVAVSMSSVVVCVSRRSRRSARLERNGERKSKVFEYRRLQERGEFLGILSPITNSERAAVRGQAALQEKGSIGTNEK